MKFLGKSFCRKKQIKKMRTGRKITGGKYKKPRKRKLFERIVAPREVRLGKEKKKTLRVRSGRGKVILLSADKINV